MPPAGHRESERRRVERAALETVRGQRKRAKSRNLPPKATDNPLVDMLQAPTPARQQRAREAAENGELTKEKIEAAIISEVGAIADAMINAPSAFKDARMGYGLRRDLLTELLKKAEGGGGGAVVTVVVNFPPERFGPAHGDQVKTGKGTA